MKHPQMYLLNLLTVKSLAQGQLDKRFWEGCECYLLPSLQKDGNTAFCKWKWFRREGFTLHHKTDEGWTLTPATSKGNSPRFSCPSALSLILWLFVSLLVKSKAPLSLVSRCKKNSKEHGANHSCSYRLCISCQSCSQIPRRATLPSPGSSWSLLWL